MRPVLCRFEPPSGLLLWFPPACVLLRRLLTARAGCVHHPFTPARLSGMRRLIPIRLPQWRADAVEMAQDVSIGLPDAGLVIRDRTRLTEGSHGRLGRFELVPGHRGEEVMLDLIVESAKPEVCHRVRSDIASREDLLAESIQRTVAPQHEHPCMIGRKDGAHV